VSASTEAATDISFPALSELQDKVATIMRADPAVEYVNSTIGPGGPNPTPNTGRMFIVLKPRDERPSSTAIIQRLRAATSVVPGMVTYYQNVQNLNVTGRASKSEFQYTLQSSNTEALYRLADEMKAKIAKVPGLRDFNSDLYI
jgi:HAE1 family hydrophobic/amphiphilic exporter-1